MKVMSRIATAALLAFTLAACGAKTGRSPQAGTSANAHDPVISVSRTHVFESLGDLISSSDAIARVRVRGDAVEGPADQAGQSPVTATTVTIDVLDRLKGEIPDSVPLRMITSPNADSEVPLALEAGKEYVLFLTPFEWEPGNATGEWTVVSGVGIYKVDGAGALELASKGPDKVPAKIESMGALKKALS